MLNRHADKYSDASIEMIKKVCKKGLFFWGYVENSEDPDNVTAYMRDFKDDEDSAECKALYKSYLKLNEETLNKLGQPQEKIPTFTMQENATLKSHFSLRNIFTATSIADKLIIKD